MSSSGAGLSRRALFGFGLSRVAERFDADAAAPPRRAPVEGVEARWRAALDAASFAPFSAAGDAVLRAADAGPGDRLLVHHLDRPDGAGEVTAFAGDLAGRPALGPPFDAVASFCGLQTTPHGFAAIGGLFGLVRPGGRIATCVWSGGVVQQLLKEASRADPAPAGLQPVWTWGRDERLRQDLGRYADDAEIVFAPLAVTLPPEALLDTLVAGIPALAVAGAGEPGSLRERLASVVAQRASADGTLDVSLLVISAVRR